jgi:hypothetical protein
MTVVAMFQWDCGRHGEISSLFTCDRDELERSYGAYLNFGDALGTGVDIAGLLEAEDITILSADADTVNKVRATFGESVTGRNPLLFLQDDSSCGSDAY